MRAKVFLFCKNRLLAFAIAVMVVLFMTTACAERSARSFTEDADISTDSGETVLEPEMVMEVPELIPEHPPSAAGLREPILLVGTNQFIRDRKALPAAAEVLPGGRVTLNFVGAGLSEVIQAVLGDILGLNFVIDPAVSGQVTVQTARPVNREDLLATFETLLRLNGAAIVPGEGFYKIVPADQAARLGAPLSTGRNESSGMPGFGLRVVPLEFVSASEIQSILEPVAPSGGVVRVDETRNVVVLAGTRSELRAMLELVEVFDVDWMRGMSFGLFPVQYTDAAELANELSLVFTEEIAGGSSGLVRFAPVDRLNAILVVSRRSEYLAQAEDWINRLDLSGETTERRVFVYQVKNGKAEDLAQILGDIFSQGTTALAGYRPETVAPSLEPIEIPAQKAGFAAELARDAIQRDQGQSAETEPYAPSPTRPSPKPAGKDAAPAYRDPIGPASELRFIPDRANNALVILATPAEYRMIEGTLRKLDVVPLQVLIEATIAEVTLNDDLRYGVQWFFQTGKTSNFNLSTIADSAPALSSAGFSYLFTSPSADVQAALDLLSEVSRVKVISSPTLMVLGNQTAQLQVGDEVPVLTRSSTSTIDPDAPIVNEIEYRDTGVILTVSPRVNPGGLVIMDIDQEASDVAETRVGATESPTIQQRRFSSTVAVQSGQSIALGGLIRDDWTKSNTGIPVLSQIPVLGLLFGRTDDLIERQELIVIITPRVVGNSEEAAQVTRELRVRMKGLEKWPRIGPL